MKKTIIGYGCPECTNQNIIYDEIRDEHYCHRCGLVVRAGYYQDGVEFPGLIPVCQKYIYEEDSTKDNTL